MGGKSRGGDHRSPGGGNYRGEITGGITGEFTCFVFADHLAILSTHNSFYHTLPVSEFFYRSTPTQLYRMNFPCIHLSKILGGQTHIFGGDGEGAPGLRPPKSTPMPAFRIFSVPPPITPLMTQHRLPQSPLFMTTHAFYSTLKYHLFRYCYP